MQVLYVYCHPLAESFHAGIKAAAVAALERAGHEVDLCDLYIPVGTQVSPCAPRTDPSGRY